MINISDLLKKFGAIEDPKKVRENISKIIKEVANVDILEDCITIKKNIVFLKLESHQKFEIFLNKKKLIEVAREHNISIEDFR